MGKLFPLYESVGARTTDPHHLLYVRDLQECIVIVGENIVHSGFLLVLFGLVLFMLLYVT
jgi:hypothetical protein